MLKTHTDRAALALANANKMAVRLNHEVLRSSVLLLGLLQDETGGGIRVLQKLGVDLAKLRHDLELAIREYPTTTMMMAVKHALDFAVEEATRMGQQVSTEHLLLGIARAGDDTATILSSHGVDTDAIRGEIARTLEKEEQPMFERYSDRASKVMALANEEAKRLGSGDTLAEHILLGIVIEGTGVGANILQKLGVDLPTLKQALTSMLQPGNHDRKPDESETGPNAKRIVKIARHEARDLEHNYIGTEHLLLAIARSADNAAEILTRQGADFTAIREAVIQLLGGAD